MAEDERLADQPLGELLVRVAAREPAPGGGTSAAVACALAAGLVEMAAAFATGAGPPPQIGDGVGADVAPGAGRPARTGDGMAAIAARATALRKHALELGQRELHSYAPVLAALRLDKTDPAREERVATALSEAAEAPLAIARAAAEVAELGTTAAAAGNPHLRGDAITGVLLAEAACRAATHLVVLDLERLAPDGRAREAQELCARADAARRRALEAG